MLIMIVTFEQLIISCIFAEEEIIKVRRAAVLQCGPGLVARFTSVITLQSSLTALQPLQAPLQLARSAYQRR